MSVTDREIDEPEDTATCPACFFEHSPSDCPEIEWEEHRKDWERYEEEEESNEPDA